MNSWMCIEVYGEEILHEKEALSMHEKMNTQEKIWRY